MRNVWLVPVFAVLTMGFGRCHWHPPPGGGGGDDGQCRRDRDCAGEAMCVDRVCECNVIALCVEGTVFNDDPSVCACEPVDGPFCGGIAGFPCPGAGMCVDDPSDDCDPNNGGADCGGLCECNAAAISCPAGSTLNDDPEVCECIPNDDKPFCGGFAGFPCPGEGDCIDDPSDDCDPNNGGADCGGLCECTVGPVIDCQPGFVFDDSPFVCACVPS